MLKVDSDKIPIIRDMLFAQPIYSSSSLDKLLTFELCHFLLSICNTLEILGIQPKP